MSRWLVRLVALFAAVALVGAACSSSDDGGGDEGSGDGTTSGDATPELTGDPVKVITIGEFSEGIALPEIPEGVEAAAESINRDGGIDGGPVEVIVCDTLNDPNTAAECGRQAVDEGVVAAVGVLSVHSDQFYPLLAENEIPVVGNVPAGVEDFTSPVSFPISGGIVSSSASLAVALADAGAERIAVARVDLPAAAVIGAFANEGLANFGLETVADVAVPENSADMAPLVASVLEADADGVIVGLPGVDATNFVVELRQTAPEVAIAMTASEIGDVFDALGSEAAGIFTNSIYVPPVMMTEATEKFVADLEAIGVDDTTGFRENSYVAMMVVADLVTPLTDRTGPSLFAALNAAVDVNPADLAPPISFTPDSGGVGGLARIFNPCGMIQEANEDGEREPVTGLFFDAFTGEDCVQPAGLG